MVPGANASKVYGCRAKRVAGSFFSNYLTPPSVCPSRSNIGLRRAFMLEILTGHPPERCSNMSGERLGLSECQHRTTPDEYGFGFCSYHSISPCAHLFFYHLPELAADIVRLRRISRVTIARSKDLDDRQDFRAVHKNIAFENASLHAVVPRLRMGCGNTAVHMSVLLKVEFKGGRGVA